MFLSLTDNEVQKLSFLFFLAHILWQLQFYCQWEREKNYLNDGIINSKPQITHIKLSFKMKVIKGANL